MTNEIVFIKEDVKLQCHRCYDCGAYWAIESFRASSAICPLCAGERNEKKAGEITRLNHQIAGLKGALKKAKKGASK